MNKQSMFNLSFLHLFVGHMVQTTIVEVLIHSVVCVCVCVIIYYSFKYKATEVTKSDQNYYFFPLDSVCQCIVFHFSSVKVKSMHFELTAPD